MRVLVFILILALFGAVSVIAWPTLSTTYAELRQKIAPPAPKELGTPLPTGSFAKPRAPADGGVTRTADGVTVRPLTSGEPSAPHGAFVNDTHRPEIAASQAPQSTPDTPSGEAKAARQFIAQLTPRDLPTLDVQDAAHFVSGEQNVRLAIPAPTVERLSTKALFSDATLGLDTPISIVKSVPQLKATTMEDLMKDLGGQMQTTVKVLQNDNVREMTLAEIVTQQKGKASEISIVTMAEHTEPTTLRELKTSGAYGLNETVRIIRNPNGVESATIAELLHGIGSVHPDSVFYVHSVRNTDQQGVWGIIHDALVDNFARGMAIRNGRALDTFRVSIPRDADERLTDRSSSFLGKMIDRKARDSTVYNFSSGRMSNDPDLIHAGRQIVIVTFSPEELVEIYRHFLRADG
ncbi:MAG: hypothetical protein K0U93_21965 [Gammaproteobacteria bacterium]|nr:hypothetical protein [Gammaproteobacteria bacterium]